jgi:hypothetical protein
MEYLDCVKSAREIILAIEINDQKLLTRLIARRRKIFDLFPENETNRKMLARLIARKIVRIGEKDANSSNTK